MAETRPYKTDYFARRRKILSMVFLLLLAAAAVLAFLFSRSTASQGIYEGKVVRISGSIDDIGLVKKFREGRSISYFSAASGFKDLIFHRFQGDYAIKIVANSAPSYLQKKKQESQALVTKSSAQAESQLPAAQPPPPVNIVSAEEGVVAGTPGKHENSAVTEMPAAAPSETPGEEVDPAPPGYAKTREAGVSEYDRDVGELASKADEIDSLWRKHSDFCQGTIAVTVGNSYGREWFGIYSTINAADTPECKMMIQDMQDLAAAIDAGMEAAWEKAHRAGVYPGQMRAIQQKYLMELDRWNK